MDDVLIVEATDHMDDGGALTDVGQEFVAQALTLGSALDQTGDIHELDDGGGGLFGGVKVGEPVQPVVGNGDHAHIGVDGAEGIVGRLGSGVGNGVEEGALAHVGQAYDTQFHMQNVLSVCFWKISLNIIQDFSWNDKARRA